MAGHVKLPFVHHYKNQLHTSLRVSSNPTRIKQEYAGTYYSDEVEVRYQVAIEGGKLVLSSIKLRTVPLRPVIEDLFGGWLDSLYAEPARGGLWHAFQLIESAALLAQETCVDMIGLHDAQGLLLLKTESRKRLSSKPKK